MITRRVVQQILLVCALAAGIAACSSSGNSSSSGASSSPSSAPSSSAPASPVSASGAAATIKTNWETFFNPKTPVAKRVSLLQDGQMFSTVIKAQAGSGLASSASAKVTKVTVVSPSQAKVTYSILLGGQPALSGHRGGRQAGRHLEGRVGQLLRAADRGKQRQDVGTPGSLQVRGLVAWSAR